MSNFIECQECENILSGEGSIKCTLYRYRKYIIGIVVGIIICYVFTRRK